MLVDFHAHALELLGVTFEEFENEHGSDAAWHALESRDANFFLNLQLMPDALDLWYEVQHLDPVILTGAPLTFIDSWWQKSMYFHNKFGAYTKVAVTQSKNKVHFMQVEGDTIVDDFVKHRSKWVDAGGFWVLHTSAEESIEQLRKLEWL